MTNHPKSVTGTSPPLVIETPPSFFTGPLGDIQAQYSSFLEDIPLVRPSPNVHASESLSTTVPAPPSPLSTHTASGCGSSAAGRSDIGGHPNLNWPFHDSDVSDGDEAGPSGRHTVSPVYDPPLQGSESNDDEPPFEIITVTPPPVASSRVLRPRTVSPTAYLPVPITGRRRRREKEHRKIQTLGSDASTTSSLSSSQSSSSSASDTDRRSRETRLPMSAPAPPAPPVAPSRGRSISRTPSSHASLQPLPSPTTLSQDRQRSRTREASSRHGNRARRNNHEYIGMDPQDRGRDPSTVHSPSPSRSQSRSRSRSRSQTPSSSATFSMNELRQRRTHLPRSDEFPTLVDGVRAHMHAFPTTDPLQECFVNRRHLQGALEYHQQQPRPGRSADATTARQLLSEPVFQSDYEEAQQKDRFGVCTVPVDSPLKTEARRLWGDPLPVTQCLGCNVGILNGLALAESHLTEFIQYFYTTLSSSSVFAVTEQMYRIFEEKIRKPFRGRIPEWRKADIFAHFTDHMQINPINRTVSLLHQLDSVNDCLINNDVFRVNPVTHRRSVNYAALKMWLDVVRTQQSLMHTVHDKSQFAKPELTALTRTWGTGKTLSNMLTSSTVAPPSKLQPFGH